jgi:hypothetical protein
MNRKEKDMSKKFLWFLIGVILMIAIPLFLFNFNAPQKEVQTPPARIQNPGSLHNAKASDGKSGDPHRENAPPKAISEKPSIQEQRINKK